MSGGVDPGESAAFGVARRIEHQIIESGWKRGTLLGNEEDLGEAYGVSRATLREAVRILGYGSLVEMRRGPRGGLFVSSPPADAVVEAMVVYFELSDLTVQEIFESRDCLETLAVGLAVERASDTALLDASNRLDSDPDIHAFSRRVVELSANAALSLFVEALLRLTDARVRERGENPIGVERTGVVAVAGHMLARDAPSAVSALREHLEASCDAVLRSGSREPPARPGRIANHGASLANAVAMKLREEIVARGWPEGHVLGSEAELTKSLGISRGTFREAVRILTYHSIAAMRRGPGGGLVVQRPEPSRAVETTCRYLAHIQFDTADLRTIRDAVERQTAALAARRITPVGAERLGRALERERLVDPAEINHISHAIHGVIAEIAGNRFLHFCIDVLTRLTSVNVDRSRVSTDLGKVRDDVNQIHSRIVTAIVHADDERAADLMGRHLEAVSSYIDVQKGRLREETNPAIA